MPVYAIAVACFLLSLPVSAAGAITGIFGNLTYKSEGGDLIGTEMRIYQEHGRYMVAMIDSEGAPGPELKVPATVAGNHITFTVAQPGTTIRYAGRINQAGFTGTYTVVSNGNVTYNLRLPRLKHSYWNR